MSAESNSSPILAIVGPTAVGKTALALRSARDAAGEIDGEIVNADALQAYRRLEIGTAKPSLAERTQVPHHLIDVLDPEERFSAVDFAQRARRAIREIRARNRRPILVGGSGLYLRTLIDGISPIPDIDPELRTELDERMEREGVAVLREELMRLDPATAQRLEATDRQRIQRALEVSLGTEKPLSYWQSLPPTGGLKEEEAHSPLRIGLTLPREILYDRISRRVGRMLDAGWMKEVKDLLASGVDPDAPAFQAIGYRQLARYVLDRNCEDFGSRPSDSIVMEIDRATRRYAKRQMTWFRKEPDVVWLTASPGRAEVDAVRSARSKEDLLKDVQNCSYESPF